ncbi:MAG: nitrate/nitrite transport system permease protein [Puniceicoccaceae bacterium 5H]|nr:MAG: nitrate/nitrite transport system permease protein [Puniceicoccaceae bacterium 5H]
MAFKYKLLKAIDVAGLQVFDPVVRLCYGEEPKLQLRRIGLFIVIPLLTLAAFVALWAYVGPRHKTKAGEVPSPAVVLQAGQDTWRFDAWEDTKAADYKRAGQDREQALAAVNARIEELEPQAEQAAAQLAEVEDAYRTQLMEQVKPLYDEYRQMRVDFRDESQRREAELEDRAAHLSGSVAEREAFLDALREHRQWEEGEKAELAAFKDQIGEIEDAKAPELEAARAQSNDLGQELQYLRKRRDQLTSDNLSLKLADAEQRLEQREQAFLQASSGEEALSLANQILAEEAAMERIETSTYAKPWTLPDQIMRSILCVFTGFVLASIIAIPIGILCGLNRVFMAAMTPLISLFKPVSPIVWLPIVFIIVGGFIPEPSDSALLDFFNAIPVLGAYDVNPAFLSSAITVALCSLWPTLVNTALGVAAIDKDHINVARVLRLGFWSRLVKIVVPSALPLIFAGLRISLGVGWMVLIAAELLSSSEGIGKFVWDMFNNGSSQTFAQMFVVVFVVGLIGLLLDRIMIVFQRLVSFDGAPTAL